MKVVAKVFMIISIIGAAIGAVVLLICGIMVLAGKINVTDLGYTTSATTVGITYIVMAFVCLLPIIFGFLGLRTLKNATCKHDLIAMGVLVLIFCNLISGIMMLAMPEDAI